MSLGRHDNGNKAPPPGPLLYQQYKEQSTLCDATIKTGLWEKQFHWCVLVASPFFNNIYKSNFLEKHTGVVELNKWPYSYSRMQLSIVTFVLSKYSMHFVFSSGISRNSAISKRVLEFSSVTSGVLP